MKAQHVGTYAPSTARDFDCPTRNLVKCITRMYREMSHEAQSPSFSSLVSHRLQPKSSIPPFASQSLMLLQRRGHRAILSVDFETITLRLVIGENKFQMRAITFFVRYRHHPHGKLEDVQLPDPSAGVAQGLGGSRVHCEYGELADGVPASGAYPCERAEGQLPGMRCFR